MLLTQKETSAARGLTDLFCNPRYVDSHDLYRSHVYFGGLCAVDFLLGHALDRAAFDRLMSLFPEIEAKDDWEAAFLDWSGYESMAAFYAAFDGYVVASG